MYTRTCELDGCGLEFQTDNKIKKHCCPAHSALNRVRRMRAKRRKGGGGGGGNGGGGGPTLFDSIEPQDPRAIYVPDTCYRTPGQPKEPASVSRNRRAKAKAAA
jgi:hypothetical protein